MKIYLDMVFLLNFGFDFLLLLTVSYLLKRKTQIKRILLGALLGGMSILFLFLPLNSVELFLLKLGMSILMTLASFSYKNFQYTFKNICYLYMVSIVLGGALYACNLQFSYQNTGILFFHNGLGINIILLCILSPVFLYFYYKQMRQYKMKYASYYTLKIEIQNQVYHLTGFMDSGNRLVDPYFGEPIIVMSKEKLKINLKEYILVPIHTIEEETMLPCIRVDKLYLEGKIFSRVWLGITDKPIEMEGIDCLLNPKLMEGC